MIVERYIGKTVAVGIVLALTVVLVLLTLFGFIDELDDVGVGKYGVLDAFLFALMSVPRYTFEAFPIAALIGSLLGLGAMASNSELTAMRAAGISVRRILLAIFKTGLLMMVELERGMKDAQLIREFIRAAREAERAPSVEESR